MKGQLIGYRRFRSKKGSPLCLANVLVPYSERDLSNGAAGSRVDEIFLPDNRVDLLQPKDVGKQVEVLHEVVGGRAFVEDFKVL